MLLDALHTCGACATLLHLDLSYNGLAMSAGSLDTLGRCTQLRTLNLAGNHITFDVSRQRQSLATALRPLVRLRYLLLAHNKLHDDGVAQLEEVVAGRFLDLHVLDLSHCFVTAPQVGVGPRRLWPAWMARRRSIQAHQPPRFVTAPQVRPVPRPSVGPPGTHAWLLSGSPQFQTR